MKRGIVFVVVMLFCVACASPLTNNNVSQNNSDALEKSVRDYSTWMRMFDTPRNVSMQLMLLCRTMNEDEQAYVESEHARYFVQVYVNPTGEKVMRETGARSFPEGTVIVKEKWMRDETTGQPTDAKQPAGLGIMYKAQDGWQYAYADASGKLTRDEKQLEHCRACHEKNLARDAVFYPTVLSR